MEMDNETQVLYAVLNTIKWNNIQVIISFLFFYFYKYRSMFYDIPYQIRGKLLSKANFYITFQWEDSNLFSP